MSCILSITFYFHSTNTHTSRSTTIDFVYISTEKYRIYSFFLLLLSYICLYFLHLFVVVVVDLFCKLIFLFVWRLDVCRVTVSSVYSHLIYSDYCFLLCVFCCLCLSDPPLLWAFCFVFHQQIMLLFVCLQLCSQSLRIRWCSDAISQKSLFMLWNWNRVICFILFIYCSMKKNLQAQIQFSHLFCKFEHNSSL